MKEESISYTVTFYAIFIVGLLFGLIIGSWGTWEMGKKAGEYVGERKTLSAIVDIGNPEHPECHFETNIKTAIQLSQINIFGWVAECEAARKNAP